MSSATQSLIKSSELFRGVYYSNMGKFDEQKGVTSITHEDYLRVDNFLMNNYDGNRLKNADGGRLTVQTSFYLLKGGVVEIGAPVRCEQIKVAHEDKSCLIDLVDHLGLPVPKQIMDETIWKF